MLVNAIAMYYEDEDERDIKTDRYEGRIHTKREQASVGFISGQKFYGEFDTERGKANLVFIVDNRTPGQYKYLYNQK